MHSVVPPPRPGQDTAQLSRVLGPFDATCVVVGAIVGVGIFFTPSRIAALTGSEPLALLTWLIAGGIALCGALTLAELGGMYHRSGAQYEILRDSFGAFPAFLFVFCNATAVQAGAIGIIALICAGHLGAAVGGGALQGSGQLLVALTLILALAAANAVGVRFGATIQNVTVVCKIITLLAVTALAIGLAPAESTAIPAASIPVAPVHKLQGVLAALVPAMFAFGGWQQALWIAGEVRQPQRLVPRAIVVGVLIVIAVYLLANWAYLHLLGVDGVARSKALAADAVSAAWPEYGRRAIAAAVAISAFGVLNAQLLAGPRLIYGMARDGRFFRPFAGLSSIFGTPLAAIALLAIVAIMPLLVLAEIDRIDRLLTWAVLVDCVFFALTGLALIVLRRKRPAESRPVRVPGYPIVPLLFVLGELGALAGALLDPSVRGAAYIGAAWIAAAAIVYAVWFRNAGNAAPHSVQRGDSPIG